MAETMPLDPSGRHSSPRAGQSRSLADGKSGRRTPGPIAGRGCGEPPVSARDADSLRRFGRDDRSEHRLPGEPAHEESAGHCRVSRTAPVEEISKRVCQIGQPLGAQGRAGIHHRSAGETNARGPVGGPGAGSASRHRLPAGAGRGVLRDGRKDSDRQTGPGTRSEILDEGEREPGAKRTVRNIKHQTPNTKEAPNTKLHDLEWNYSLGFGAWDSSGTSSLGFDVSPAEAP